ncbi:hypothetical protein [Sedimentitalea sp.]|uniref:hypothetical protein n=1 Tax=Sedimentitalea sp. TaxID=2048915 RepID=UPI00329682AF
MSTAPTPAFETENARLAALADHDAVDLATPHQDLGPHIWLSSQPDSGARLGFAPTEGGFLLRMETAGQSPWVSLSYSLDFATVQSGRYVGLILQVVSDGLFAFRPCLRLLKDEGYRDVFADQHMASSGGAHLLQGHIAIPQDQIADSRGAELHLFFSGDAFEARIERMETVLMR